MFTTVNIPDGVEVIGPYAFIGCPLKTVTIPGSVNEICEGAFQDCQSLTDVYFMGTEEEWDEVGKHGTLTFYDATIHFLENEIEDEDTDVKVEYEDDKYDGDVNVEADLIPDDGQIMLTNDHKKKTNAVIYDISTLKEGMTVQPNGKITVKIPAPEGYKNSKIFVFYIDNKINGREWIPARIINGYVVFEVDHFSLYAVADLDFSFSLNKKSVSLENIGDTIQLSAVVDSEIAIDNSEIVWKSSDYDVAVVDSNGFVTRIGEGACTITAMFNGESDKKTTCVITNSHDCDSATLENVQKVAADCNSDGNTEHYICSCGRYYEDAQAKTEITSVDIEIESIGHSWSEWKTTLEPTDITPGSMQRVCISCQDRQTKEIPATESKIDPSPFLKLLRGTASIKLYNNKGYVAITMTPGKTVTGIYKDMTDGGTVELVNICGNIQVRTNDYVAYQSQNKTNPVATMKVTYADGTVETYPVVFELYEMEIEINFNPTTKIKPIRGKVSMGTDVKGDYILVEMVEGQSSVGVYKASLDGTTATLDGAEGVFTEQEKLYIFYGSQNTFNPEGRLTVTEADGSQSTYRVVFKMYEMDPYVNVAKGLRPVRGAVTFDAAGTIRIKMTKGQKSVGLYKTMANGATFKITDANGRVTNNPSSVMFYMTNNTANVTATMIFTLPDGTTKEQKIIFDMGLASDPDPLTYLTAVRGTVSYQNDGTEDYIEVKANALSTGVGLNKDCLVKYTITDVDGVMTENDSRYYIYKSQNPNGVTANINFLQSDGSYKTYKVKFVF